MLDINFQINCIHQRNEQKEVTRHVKRTAFLVFFVISRYLICHVKITSIKLFIFDMLSRSHSNGFEKTRGNFHTNDIMVNYPFNYSKALNCKEMFNNKIGKQK